MIEKLLLLVLLIIIPGCHYGCLNSNTDDYISHTLQCGYANGWDLEVTLNGIPVHGSEKSSGVAVLNYFIVNGSNTLTVRATQINKEKIWGPLPITMWRGDEENAFKEKLLDIVIEAQEDGYKFEKTYTFDAVMPVQWTWQTASVIGDLSDTDRKEILSEVQTLHAAFKSKDPDKVMKIMKLANEEMAKYHGPKVGAFRDRYEEIIANPNFRPQIKKDNEILIEVGERVVLVSGVRDDLNHKTPIITLVPLSGSSDEKSFWAQGVVFRELVLCKIDGKWKIVLLN